MGYTSASEIPRSTVSPNRDRDKLQSRLEAGEVGRRAARGLLRIRQQSGKTNVLACFSSPRFQRRLVDFAVAQLVTTQIAMKILVGTLVNSVVV
jgi:hypothetical protein